MSRDKRRRTAARCAAGCWVVLVTALLLGCAAQSAQPVQRLVRETFAQQQRLPEAPLLLDNAWRLGEDNAPASPQSICDIPQGTEAAVLWRDTATDAARFNAFRVRMRITAGVIAKLTWESGLEPVIDANPGVSWAVQPDGQFHEYTVRLSPGQVPTWAGRITHLRFTPSNKPSAITMTDCRLLWLPPEAPVRANIAQHTREALLGSLPPWRITVPPEAIFEVSLGMAERSWREGHTNGVKFVVALEAAGEEKLLVEQSLHPATTSEHRNWMPFRVDLSAYAGQEVDIRLKQDHLGDAAGDYAYWGAPLVFSRERSANAVPIILISCDTLRADHLSCYGYERPTTPHLDAWAKDEAVVFENAITTSTWTLPSHISMHTGITEKNHGVTFFIPLPESTVTIAEALSDQNYLTAGFTGFTQNLRAETGMGHGFDSYNLPLEGFRSAFDTLALTAAWLEDHPVDRCFLFYHNFDCHSLPKSMPAVEDSIYGPTDPRFAHFTATTQKPDFPLTEIDRWDAAIEYQTLCQERIDERAVQWGITGYDDALRSVDQAIFELFNKLKALDLYNNALILVTADHGEEFGEHYRYGHTTIYEECCHVPLLAKFPHGSFGGTRVKDMVRVLDVFPTILGMAGAPVPTDIDGKDLREVFAPQPAPRPPAELMGPGVHIGVRTQSSKAILRVPSLVPEWYDLAQDPGELHNRADEKTQEINTVHTAFRNLIDNSGWVICLYPGEEDWPVNLVLQVPEGIRSFSEITGIETLDLERDQNADLPLNPTGFSEDLRINCPYRILLRPNPGSQERRLVLSVHSDEDFSLVLGRQAPRTMRQVDEVLDCSTHKYEKPAQMPKPPLTQPTVVIWHGDLRSAQRAESELSAEEIEELQSYGYLN